MRTFRLRMPSPAFVISLLALAVALGGTAYAAFTLPKNSVGTKQLKRGAVTTEKIKDGNVTASKISDAAVTTSKLADNAVTSGKIADAAITTSKLADNAVTSGKIADAAVTTSKLADNAVTSGKIADGQVRAGDLGTIITAQNTVQIAAGADGTVDVACPAGSVVLSGGGYWTTGANSLRTTLKQGNGWRVEGRNTTTLGEPLTVQAYCLPG